MDRAAQKYVEDRSQPIPHVGCWLWLKSIGTHGYGQAGFRRKVTVAHRVSYIAFVGPIPRGVLVQHSCDNRWCVNPDHLSLGTDATNAEDKRRKGRACKKLSVRDRAFIACAYFAGEMSKAELARRFDVDPNAISMVVAQGFNQFA